MVEVFVPVKEFEDRYEISNYGRVRTVHKCLSNGYCFPVKLMKLIVHNNGYQVVWLRKPKVHKKFFVHRLVAFHFLEVIDGKDYVNHKDKNRLNNHLSNLEFMTHKENCDHRDGKNCNDEPF